MKTTKKFLKMDHLPEFEVKLPRTEHLLQLIQRVFDFRNWDKEHTNEDFIMSILEWKIETIKWSDLPSRLYETVVSVRIKYVRCVKRMMYDPYYILILIKQSNSWSEDLIKNSEREFAFNQFDEKCSEEIMRFLILGKDSCDIKKLIEGEININWLHPDMPEYIPKESLMKIVI